MLQYDLKVTGPFKDNEWDRIYRNEIEKGLDRSVTLGEEEMIRQISRKGLKFQGGLIGGVFGDVVRWDRGVIGVQGRAAKYAEVMDLGRKPGSKIPPYYALYRWVWLKLREIDAEVARFINRKPGRKRQKRGGGYLTPLERQKQRAKGLGIAIAKKIHREGIKGRHYVAATERALKPKIDKIFETVRMNIDKKLSG